MRVNVGIKAHERPDWRRQEKILAILLLAPSVAYLLLMSVFPTFYSLYLALSNFTLYRPDLARFVGLSNFQFLLGDSGFWQSVRVTLIFAVASVALEFALGLGLALLLDRKMKGIGLLRTLLIVPVLISPVGMGLTFRYILAPSYGLLNFLLSSAGLAPVNWIVSPTFALPAVIFADLWQWTPFVALILLAGIQSISTEIVEAAQLDGLTEWQMLWRMTLPLIRPVVLVVILIRLIDAIRSFDMVFVLTRGGPGASTEVLSILSYVDGFTSGDMATASAIAWITVVIVNILVILFMKALSKTEAA